ncbi:MAG: HAMP domain-containing histidine kinase [Clostridiales bacterium]|nr:HAMP domain-containing histidine kinase [Clostridiales bacterium]
MLCYFVQKQYYDLARITLESRATEMVLSYFDNSPSSSNEQFVDTARSFIDEFSDKNVMEVWVIDSSGKVVASSTGFSVVREEYPDYNYAKADGKKGEWIGTMSNGEIVMAQTYIINSENAAVRYIVSLQDINTQLTYYFILVAIVDLVVILLSVLSGAFFIRSIIKPVKDINETTKKIASGNYDIEFEKYKYNDEIGELYDSVNNMTNEIKNAEEMKNEFISTISHELRTPLTAIKGWGETIGNSKDDKEVIDKGISVIVSESERLTELVEELLDFSKMESGKLTLKKQDVDISEELEKTVAAFSERSDREKISIKSDIKKGIVISADSNRLRQVFVNIIDNAFKYNKINGFIDIKMYSDKDYVYFDCKDNGCGIPENDLPKIKEKFYKGNSKVRGSGIGLAVSDEIVSLHGGSLDIKSKINKGTTVSVKLPNLKEQK